MERVVTISLNGNAYQLEAPAFDAVRAYLTRAETALASNPDKAEIVRDLEQAIADKCATYLSPAKTVVTASEMAKTLDEMGPVEGEADASAAVSDADEASPPPRKRLYRLTEVAQIAGVCAGLSAYFDINVRILRAIFVFATLLTWGAAALVYIVMMFLIPPAKTNEDWAAAHGAPFNAQDVIDRAKREQSFADDESSWRAMGRAMRRKLRRDLRSNWRRDGWAYGPPATPLQAGPVTRTFEVLFAILLGVLRIAAAIIVLSLIYAALTSGSLHEWTRIEPEDGVIFAFPGSVDTWLPIVVLLIVFGAVFRTLRTVAYGRYRYDGARVGDGLAGLIVLALIVGFTWQYVPEARTLLARIPDAVVQFGEFLRAAISQSAAPFIR